MNNPWYLAAGLGSFVLAVILTPLVQRLARSCSAVDDPAADPARKHHGRVVPLWGGAAVIAASLLTWWGLAWSGHLVTAVFPWRYVIGLSAAAIILLVGGLLDDRYRLPAGQQIWWTIAAALVVVLSGIGVEVISNPFGGTIHLDQWSFAVGSWHVSVLAALFAMLWIIGLTYTTKILDGLDGLVTGFGTIGAMIVFLLTLRPEVDQPSVALIALSLAGACAGFLLFNWHPAKIFLGESGSLYIGFLLGALSIISGSKIATALLIMGLPILDLAWVIIQRRFFRNLSPFLTADRLHLHYRLRDAGLSVRQSVLLLWAISIVFGLSTLWFHGLQKVFVLIGVLVVMAGLVIWAGRRVPKRLDQQGTT